MTSAPPPLKLSGLEPVAIDAGSLFVNIGERTNVTGSKAFARMILAGQFEQALAVARRTLHELELSRALQQQLLVVARLTLEQTKQINAKIPGVPVFPTAFPTAFPTTSPTTAP